MNVSSVICATTRHIIIIGKVNNNCDSDFENLNCSLTTLSIPLLHVSDLAEVEEARPSQCWP